LWHILIPKYKEEDDHFVAGQYEPLISESLFYQVQDVWTTGNDIIEQRSFLGECDTEGIALIQYIGTEVKVSYPGVGQVEDNIDSSAYMSYPYYNIWIINTLIKSLVSLKLP